MYGEGVISTRVCQQWFARFRAGKVDVDDNPRSGRPRSVEADQLQQLLDDDSRQSTRELGTKLEVDHATVLRRLHEMGKIQKVGYWVPHDLSEQNKCQRMQICTSLISRFEKENFLSEIVTGDEK